MTSIPTIIDDQTVLYCPACGYDLRASSDGRCNECGLAIDRAALRVSAFPWAHRKEMGRVRAYLKTLWQVLVDRRTLAYETAKPQDAKAARSFARVTGAILAITFLGPFAAAVADDGGLGFLAVSPDPSGSIPWLNGWMADVLVPWSAGATLWPVPILCIVLYALYLARAAVPMFRSSATQSVPPERATSIALYTSAPLVILLLAVLTLWGFAIMIWLIRERSMGPEGALLLLVASALIAFVSLLATYVRTGQWLARVRHGGFLTGVGGAAWLFALWLWGAFAYGIVLPWCIGFLWVVIDSLR